MHILPSDASALSYIGHCLFCVTEWSEEVSVLAFSRYDLIINESKNQKLLVSFQGCLDPYQMDFHMYQHQLMVSQQVLFYCYMFTIIYSNLYLYRFLRTHTDHNIVITESNKKKARKLNFVPAKELDAM